MINLAETSCIFLFKNEVRIQYVYFGKTSIRAVSNNDEGELFWIDKGELFNRNLYITTRFVLEHYLGHENEINDILVGTINADNNRPIVNWSPVQDWEGGS